LTALPASSRREAFFACWTRKEAYLKARGDGLSVPLHHFSVSLTPGAPAALLWVKGDPDARSRWTLGALSPSPDYVGALALQGALGRCVCRRIEW
ncbi:MAG: 4'-phosphopantetheinyl transferase superfamily protein, partial [Chloroflexi bacterium]|nr:4'-phosphopantetheinyl transferase superfamily protein [Chloroflexota bacterium]